MEYVLIAYIYTQSHRLEAVELDAFNHAAECNAALIAEHANYRKVECLTFNDKDQLVSNLDIRADVLHGYEGVTTPTLPSREHIVLEVK
jgi:hypothetical protein